MRYMKTFAMSMIWFHSKSKGYVEINKKDILHKFQLSDIFDFFYVNIVCMVRAFFTLDPKLNNGFMWDLTMSYYCRYRNMDISDEINYARWKCKDNKERSISQILQVSIPCWPVTPATSPTSNIIIHSQNQYLKNVLTVFMK